MNGAGVFLGGRHFQHAAVLICLTIFIVFGVSPKKGVGAWYFKNASVGLKDANLAWFYTWEPSNYWITAPSGVQFVPMIWDETHVTTKELGEAKATGAGILLGFNEPDHSGQANMSVTQALDLWPKLMETGLRLGSPATANNPSSSGSWFEKFMTGVKDRGYRVDFICVHWYGKGSDATTETANLKSFLQAAYNKYQKPIWLTEYALVKWYSTPRFPTYEQQAAFVTKSTEMMETLSFVERYAWFALPPWKDGDLVATTNLYNENGAATAVGVAFREAGVSAVQPPATPTLKAPENAATNVNVSPELTWNTVSNATSYRIQVSAVSTFISTIADKSALTSTAYVLSGLAAKTKYYWRVNATGSGGTGAWSSIWSFITAQPVKIETMADISQYGLTSNYGKNPAGYDLSGRSSHGAGKIAASWFAPLIYQGTVTIPAVDAFGIRATSARQWQHHP